MTVEEFQQVAAEWAATAKDPHFDRLYTQLAYQPMLEVLNLLRDNDFRTYIVSGGGQAFIRSYAEDVYGIPPEQVIGTTFETAYGYGDDGTPTLTKVRQAAAQQQQRGQAAGHQPLHRQATGHRLRQLDRRPADAGVGQWRASAPTWR